VTALTFGGPGAWAAGCLDCHPSAAVGHASGHAFGATDCGPCHGGDPLAAARDAAHQGLVAFPGQMADVPRTCGGCHPAQVEAVRASPMATLRGMVATTRRVIAGDGHSEHLESSGRPRAPDAGALPSGQHGPGIAGLGSSPADTLLRKLCVGCHLGRPKTRHAHDPVRDRGGGCLACHVNAYRRGAHPEVSARVEDARCFGCHSRSGRISLSYAGLAEVNEDADSHAAAAGRLADGRWVERRAADAHHRAGLACIDCHTGAELMDLRPPAGLARAPEAGASAAADRQRGSAGSVRCVDCHGPTRVQARLEELSAWQRERLRGSVPTGDPQRLVALTGRHGTPLAGLEITSEGTFLHRRIGGGRVAVPPYRAVSHSLAGAHTRLGCETCHSEWAPRCYGCHLVYDPASPQWDHVAGAETPGRWRERRWATRNGLPLLGVRADGRVGLFVPGMVMTVAHPDWPGPELKRIFAAITPHTTGRARGCPTCHRSAEALGLGAGRLARGADGWTLEAEHPALADGLPPDAWTDLGGARAGAATRPGDRPLAPAELRRVLAVDADNR